MPESSMKILIVDDFSTMRRIVKNVLKELGFSNFAEAENGEQAYSILQGGGFEFVISDWNMPVMDGLALVNKIRSDTSLKEIPILMVTAEAEKDKVVFAKIQEIMNTSTGIRVGDAD